MRPAEDTTWQWEPFFWSNGGNATFANIAGAPGVQALSLWKQLITDGSASKDCLQLEPDSRRVDASSSTARPR